MGALRTYSSSAYKNDIELLIMLFTELGEPEVDPVGVCKHISLEIDSSGNGSKPVSRKSSTINRNVKKVTYVDVVRGEKGG